MSARLATRMVAKPWGRADLPAPFTGLSPDRIGEVWFEPPPLLDRLLVKYIFTSEPLSVQVHPTDDQTLAAGQGRQGKEECWLVIAAEPGARLGIGLREPASPEKLRAAALDGSIEDLLEWHPVTAGDFFYIPANTVHAIGGGISLVEVQQNSDITYRLYDYGRPRELHLDAGLAVAQGAPHPANCRLQVPGEGAVQLVDGPLFRLDRIAGQPAAEVLARYGEAPVLAVPLRGTVRIGDEAIAAGECGVAGSLAELAVPDDALVLIAQPLG